MQQEHCTENDIFVIDVLKIIKTLWRRLWLILLAAAVFGGSMFVYKKVTYVPKYKATATMYASLTSNEQVVAIDYLTGTCTAVLKTRSTLEAIIDAAELDMLYTDLGNMISSSAISKSPMFKITVTGFDPEEVTRIVNIVADTLPSKVSAIYDAGEVGVVDYALVPEAPSNSDQAVKKAVTAAALGAFMVCGIIVVQVLYTDWVADRKKKSAQ